MHGLFRYPRLAMVIITMIIFTLKGAVRVWLTRVQNGGRFRYSITIAERQSRLAIRNRGPPGTVLPRRSRCIPAARRLLVRTDRKECVRCLRRFRNYGCVQLLP
jgi:hypothetical protein